MKNKEFAALLNEIADILEMQGQLWEPRAYRRAARSINSWPDDLAVIAKKTGTQGLEEIEGVGKKIAAKILEFLTTGTVQEFETIRHSIPPGVLDLMKVPGLGPKKAWKLYHERHIKNVNQLRHAAEKGTIQQLSGFGKKSEQEILQNTKFTTKGTRHLLSEMLPIANTLCDQLRKQPFVERVEIAGSLRRMKETIKDIDLLVMSKNPDTVIEFIKKNPLVTRIHTSGPTKTSLIIHNTIPCDIRVVPKKSFGAALAYFTGSKDHNIQMRRIALTQKKKLSEYGLFSRTGTYLAGTTEEGVYHALGLPWIPPEMREMQGELQLKPIPHLVQKNDIRGDCHMHSTWSDGKDSLEAMVLACKRLGYEYVAITDHSASATYAHGLTTSRLQKKIEEIKKIQKKIKGIHILTAAEVDILADGTLDYPTPLLKELDLVIASVHRSFHGPVSTMTKRIVNAFSSGMINCFAHPLQRKIGIRDHLPLDIETLLTAARTYHVALEVNSNPIRLDLNGEHVRKAIQAGVHLMINSDAHRITDLPNIRFGIGQARRGWATKNDIVNTLPWKKFEQFLMKE